MSPLRLDWAEQAGWGYQTPERPSRIVPQQPHRLSLFRL
jgi:hypothetical protein